MTTEVYETSLEPDLFGVIRDRWPLILGLAFLFGLIGLVVGSARPTAFESTASVVVEDPRNAALFESGSGSRPERYVETQIGILNSPAVAERASELLAESSPRITLSPADILAGSTVASQESSDLISVTFVSGAAEEAEGAADAIINAYLELRSSEAVAGFSSALAQLDQSIAEARQELADLESQITASRGSELVVLQQKAEELATRLVELRTTDSGNSDAIAEEIAALRDQLAAIETAFRLETLEPELAALLESQRLAQSRLSGLLARRSEVRVDAELAGGGFVFQTQATPARATNPSPRAYAAIAGVIGLMVGVAIAYALAIWRRRVSSPEQPERILQAPSLGSIPEFDVVVRSPLPVANASHSHTAEAFRLVMAAIESQMFRPGSSPNAASERLLLVTSASHHDGRSIVAANLAQAAARAGRKVLVLDADFTTQRVSELLNPQPTRNIGISEVLLGAIPLESAIVRPQSAGDGDLSLLSRGSDLIRGEDVFGSLEAADLLDSLRMRFDLVLVDSPPLSAVGYATTLARLADRVLVVVRHRTLVSRLEEVSQRLRLIQSRTIGYVYNRAPGNVESWRGDRVRSSVTAVREPGDPASTMLEKPSGTSRR